MDGILVELAEHIATAYLGLVREAADAETIDPKRAADILARAGRRPEQLQADVDRLRLRRQAAADVAKAEQLTRDVEAARSRYADAVANESRARTRLDLANRDARTQNNLQARQAVNEARAAVAQAVTARGAAFGDVEAAIRARDTLRTPAVHILEDTREIGADAMLAERFALTP